MRLVRALLAAEVRLAVAIAACRRWVQSAEEDRDQLWSLAEELRAERDALQGGADKFLEHLTFKEVERNNFAAQRNVLSTRLSASAEMEAQLRSRLERTENA